MKELESILKTVAEGLKSVAGAVEQIADKVEDLAQMPETKAAKAETARKPTAKKAVSKKRSTPAKSKKKSAAPTKRGNSTAISITYGIIKRSKQGVDTATLTKKTGYDTKKVQNLIYKLKKQGKIKSAAKGIYQSV